MRRVYHPTLNHWDDVADGDAAAWKSAGWRLTKPDHVDDSDALPVGEYRVPSVASVTVGDGNPAATPAAAAPAAKTAQTTPAVPAAAKP